LVVCLAVEEVDNLDLVLSASQAAEEAERRSLALLAACSTHNNGWAQPWFLVFLEFLVYNYPGTAPLADVAVASKPGPHKSAHEVSSWDRQNRSARRTGGCWRPRIQRAHSSCFGLRKKSLEFAGILVEGRQRSYY
jgi:hypothetical protein